MKELAKCVGDSSNQSLSLPLEEDIEEIMYIQRLLEILYDISVSKSRNTIRWTTDQDLGVVE